MHERFSRVLKRSAACRAGILLCLLILLPALLAPLFSPYLPGEYCGQVFAPPSAAHLLGTNDVGQDIWTRLWFGARTSVCVGAAVAFIATTLALTIGGSAPFYGGIYDQVIMRLVDALLVIPPILIAILAATYLRPNLLTLILLLAFFIWPSAARIFRTNILSIKNRNHLDAARTFGASERYLMVRHVIPMLGPVLFAVAIQHARRAIFMEAGLSFLGVTDPNILSWGTMLHHALQYTYLDVWKWWLLPTGFSLSLSMTSLALLGFGLEMISNPRLFEAESKC